MLKKNNQFMMQTPYSPNQPTLCFSILQPMCECAHISACRFKHRQYSRVITEQINLCCLIIQEHQRSTCGNCPKPDQTLYPVPTTLCPDQLHLSGGRGVSGLWRFCSIAYCFSTLSVGDAIWVLSWGLLCTMLPLPPVLLNEIIVNQHDFAQEQNSSGTKYTLPLFLR